MQTWTSSTFVINKKMSAKNRKWITKAAPDSLKGFLLSMSDSLLMSQVAHFKAGAYSGFCSMKRLGIFLLPPGWDASPLQGYPSIKFASTHLCSWVERGTVRVKCLAQEHNTMSLARAPTRTSCSAVECTNHETTVLPTMSDSSVKLIIINLPQLSIFLCFEY